MVITCMVITCMVITCMVITSMVKGRIELHANCEIKA